MIINDRGALFLTPGGSRAIKTIRTQQLALFNSKDSTMKVIYLITATLALIPLISGAPGKARQSSVTTQLLVEQHGYPFEEHSVQTSDGYILGLHRIPYSGRVESGSEERRPVVFLMHGLLCSSSDWVLLGPDNSLAFKLSDAGYDVWLGNARGNTYSREHVKYNPLFKKFWSFDWHEIAMYDLPAMMDYVLYYTDEEQLTYFGHSQGTTTFLVLNSLNLRFNSRIKSAHLLAPVAFMENMEGPLVDMAAILLGQPNIWPELFGDMEFLPSTKAMELLGYTACRDNSLLQDLCANVIFLITGYDYENLNSTILPEIIATTPAGSSINQITHFLQEYNSGYFRQFDYGKLRNSLTYGSSQPPEYPLEDIDVPIFLYYSDNDYLSSVVDVHRLMRTLKETTMRRAYRVPHPKWNHLDHIWGMNIKEQLHDAIMEDLESMKDS
ncbi:lipase 3-like [Eupeodes corollae]|uniref:lipase 3-like n=1 Tax=Eupeodes corollae TaxID=290404 RepID=UPI00249081BF|nr:lipase 3-like [Eupeodes corollae]